MPTPTVMRTKFLYKAEQQARFLELQAEIERLFQQTLALKQQQTIVSHQALGSYKTNARSEESETSHGICQSAL